MVIVNIFVACFFMSGLIFALYAWEDQESRKKKRTSECVDYWILKRFELLILCMSIDMEMAEKMIAELSTTTDDMRKSMEENRVALCAFQAFVGATSHTALDKKEFESIALRLNTIDHSYEKMIRSAGDISRKLGDLSTNLKQPE